MSTRQDNTQIPKEILQARKLARLTDGAFRVPGTRLSFGWDFIVGLIPGLGDLLMGLVSLRLVMLARKLGAPWILCLRMTANSLADFLLGSVPVVGDLLDIFFKANRRNLALLESWWEKN
ncbi:DUF4112 domain-containing protein [Bowmanella dokdonensis]|uniref:DUF4112 domain-containing protein n=1 Tax=Bowmanella dokdonensis TaxID=751969 RepID=A0A939DL09_9ALTE|nr:DUF4112 domain-containing protein [Bowmanella dokdonensis]MBN7824247.1 DUF4112 domain-containing protein [Bowmanella dokdonensis]